MKIDGLWSRHKPKNCILNPKNKEQDQNTGTTSPGTKNIKINFAEYEHDHTDNDSANTVASD